ncbi:MAG TPA: DMT family transporter [Verrucomicrobiae bacterium]|nr:DMT family transporter [Verrucomicrobiae bacterium]
MQNRGSNWALLAVVAGAVGIGFAPIWVRLSETGPTATAFWRVALALPLLWIRAKPVSQKPWLMIVACGFLFAADLTLWHWSLKLTSVTNSTLLSNLAPLFVTLAAHWLFQEKITPLFMVGLFLGIAGMVVLVGKSFQFGNLKGDMLAVITAVFYAGYLLSVKQLRRVMDPITVMMWSGLFSAPCFLAVAVLSGDTLVPATVQGWIIVAALAVVSHIGGQTLIAYALGRLPASFSSITLLLQPVVAALLAWPILGEPVTTRQVIGGIVILAGIALAHLQLSSRAADNTLEAKV